MLKNIKCVNTSSSTVKIAFIGDVFLSEQHTKLNTKLCNILSQCDHVVANLESPICLSSPIEASKILLRSHPNTELVLKNWGVTAVTLANNHIFDHGEKGFQATCKALKSVQIQFTGAGMNRSEAACPLLFEIGKFRIAMISCTEPGTQAQIAKYDTPGCHHLTFPDIGDQIRHLKQEGNLVIIAPHWGYCDYAYPPREVVDNGEKLLAAGADIVIGHHSHVVQGMSRKNGGKIIAYSLGNFFFGGYNGYRGRKVITEGEDAKGLCIIVEMSSHALLDVKEVFTCQKGNWIEIDAEIVKRNNEFKRRCIPLNNLSTYPNYWRKVVRKRIYRRLTYWINPLNWREMKWATLKALWIMIK